MQLSPIDHGFDVLSEPRDAGNPRISGSLLGISTKIYSTSECLTAKKIIPPLVATASVYQVSLFDRFIILKELINHITESGKLIRQWKLKLFDKRKQVAGYFFYSSRLIRPTAPRRVIYKLVFDEAGKKDNRFIHFFRPLLATFSRALCSR